MSATAADSTVAPLVDCPIDGRCNKGKRHRMDNPTYQKCLERAGAQRAAAVPEGHTPYMGTPHRGLRARLGEATEALRVSIAQALRSVAAELRNYEMDYRHDPAGGHRFVFTDRRDGSWHSVGSPDLRAGWTYSSGLAGQDADRTTPLTGENHVARFAVGAGGETTDLSAEEIAHRTQVHIQRDERRRQDPVEVVLGPGEVGNYDEVSIDSLDAHQIGNLIRGDYEDSTGGMLTAEPTYTDGNLSGLQVHFSQHGEVQRTWMLSGEDMPELAPSSAWPRRESLDWSMDAEPDWLIDRVAQPLDQGEGWDDQDEIGTEDGEAQAAVVVGAGAPAVEEEDTRFSGVKWLQEMFKR